MNTLPVNLTSAANAASATASKGRNADAPDSESPFRQALKDEIAERRQAGAGAAQTAGKAERSEAQPQSRSSSVEDGREKDATETASAEGEAPPADMAQYLALTSQFAQQVVNTQAASSKDGSMDAGSMGVAADSAAGALAGAGKAGSPLAAALAKPDGPAVLQGDADAQRAAGDGNDFAAAVDQARQAQLAAASEKGAQAASAADVPAGSGPHAELLVDAQQPGLQAASFTALQQAGIDRLQQHADASADRIAPRVASSGWNQAIGQKVVWMVGNDQQSASLTLNPPDLGPLQVVISVSESTATANFVSAHPEVRQALEAAMPRLREMLGEAGIQLGQAQVGAGTSGDYGAQGQQTAQSFSGAGEPAFSTSAAPLPAQTIRRGLVDTFA